MSFQIQHKGLSFIERAHTAFQKTSVPLYRFLNFSGEKNPQCSSLSQLSFLFRDCGLDLELKGQGFLVSVVLLQTVTVSISVGTKVPHLSQPGQSAGLLNCPWAGLAIGLLRKLTAVDLAGTEQQDKASSAPGGREELDKKREELDRVLQHDWGRFTVRPLRHRNQAGLEHFRG